MHSYWLFKEPEKIKDVSYVEGIIKGITQRLGGDIGTHDITRILRVPGSTNLKIPDRPRLCQIIEFNKEIHYKLSDFEHYALSLPDNQALPDVSFPENLPKIDLRTLKIDLRIKKLIQIGDVESIYASRSECDLAVINAIILAGYDDAIVKAIFSDPKRKISEKYLERASKNQSADAYLAHQIGKARVLKENINKINAFLKEGKTEEATTEIDKLPDQYRERYKNRLKQQNGESFNIFEANNRYFKIVKKGDNEIYFLITNFVIRIKNRYITAGECTREVYFVNINGNKTKEFILEPQQMVSTVRFKEFCISKGNFIFEGTEKELAELWKLEFSKDEGRIIYQPDHVGYLKEHGFWLFNNCAIKNGEYFQQDEDGVVWIDNCGFKLLPLNYRDIESLPHLRMMTQEETLNLETQLIDMLKNNIGGYEAWLALGCAKAWIYSNEIFKALGFFPILFIYGKTRVGKDTIAGWLLAICGIMRTTVESLPGMTSPVGISRKGGYFASLPVWLDEYRNENKIIRFNGFFRNLFNRTGASKGLKANRGTYSEKIRANFVFSGEQLPEDPALRNRCVAIRLSKNKRDDSYYNAINEASRNFSAIGLKWIREKTPESIEQLLSSIENTKKELVEIHGLESDLAEIYAVPLAAFLTLRKDKDFCDWVIQEAKREKLEKKEADIVTRFFDDIEGLHSRGIVNEDHFILDGGRVFIWFNEVYRLWKATFKSFSEAPFPRDAILNYIKEEEYWIEPEKDHNGKSKTQKKLGGTNRRCIILDYNTLPESLKAVVGG